MWNSISWDESMIKIVNNIWLIYKKCCFREARTYPIKIIWSCKRTTKTYSYFNHLKKKNDSIWQLFRFSYILKNIPSLGLKWHDVTWESECRNWHFATFEKIAIKVWDLVFLIVLCRIGLKFSIWNDIIVLKILTNSDKISLFIFLDNKDLNLRYDTESHLNCLKVSVRIIMSYLKFKR